VNVDQLRRELRRARIGGRQAGRIVAEFEDHLAFDPDADLGDPRCLAREFADELGTKLARSAAIRTAAALAVCAVAMLLVIPGASNTYNWVNFNNSIGPFHISLFDIGIFVAVFFGQVSLAAAVLALLGANRLSRAPVISATEAMILRRRALVAWVSGGITIGSLALMGLVIPTAYGPNWELEVLVGAGVCGVALLSVIPMVLRAAWVRPAAEGPTHDLVADLAPFVPSRASRLLTPWRCAVLLAALVAVVLTGMGVVNDDPLAGALRGATDALACLAGFSLLGGYLGLVRPGVELQPE
jgi:hypothetical protein